MKRLLCLLGLSLGLAVAQGVEAGLDTRLTELERQGFNQPEQALQALRALRAAPEHAAQRLRIDFAIGRVQALGGDAAQAEQLADQLARQAGGQPLAELLRAELLDRRGQPVKASALAGQALAKLGGRCPLERVTVLRPECDWRATWQALILVARGQRASGDQAFAEATLRQSLVLAQSARDDNLSAYSMGMLALIAQGSDQPASARQWISEAAQLVQGNGLGMVRVKVFESYLASQRGDTRSQLRALEEALVLAQQAGAPRDMAQVRNNLADAYIHQKQPTLAAAQARLALPVVQAFKDLRLERTLRHNLSVALVQLRQLEAARREIARVNELIDDDGDNVRRSNQLRELGQAYAGIGQYREAVRLYHEERALSAAAAARTRESSLQQLRQQYDSAAKERDLELLKREQSLQDQQLANRRLAQYVGVALVLLLGLSLILMLVMLSRVREANRRLKAKQALLRAQSERDPLTDLANRRHFLAVMERHTREVFNGALLMIDIDHFKHVNDRHGHAAGDAVICEVARRISQAVREEDLVVRWGGEEFLVFAHEVAPEQLRLLARRILTAIGQQPVATPAGPLRVTASIGFAHFPLPPAQLALHWEQAVNWADMALYTAKAQGRNRAVGIVTVQAEDAQALLQIEADFDAACQAQRVQLLCLDGPPPP
jgi:diguanylate cyclase (GGDEF)-like protein